MDAWSTLAALSTTGDAWERLNTITGGGATAGLAIDEIKFTLDSPISLLSSLLNIGISSNTNLIDMSYTTTVVESSSSLEPESITVMESC